MNNDERAYKIAKAAKRALATEGYTKVDWPSEMMRRIDSGAWSKEYLASLLPVEAHPDG